MENDFVLSRFRAFVLFCFLSFCFSANSQIVNTLPYEFSYGASAGATFSSVSFNPSVVQGYSQGITFGVTGRMTMGENVGLQLELNYVQQGWAEDFSETETPDYKYNRKLDYIQLPFYTHVQFGGKSLKAFINAGPQLGYFLSESTSENLNGASPGRVNYQHNMPVENRFEWGIG
ncbi:MAG: PorT family protein, partial [Tannerella sp.]|nr:PorT family protein [Tannerella sp.]